ncbi:MAG: ATP-binding cassette domain-containing protein [Myxococcota bacterium]
MAQTSTALLAIEDAARRIGGRTLFEGVRFQIRRGDRIGLVGPNGAGKTTLLRSLLHPESLDAGTIRKPRSVQVALLRQELDPGTQRPVSEEVASARPRIAELERELQSLEAEIAGSASLSSDLAGRYDHAQAEFRAQGGFDWEARVAETLGGLGFNVAAQARSVASFSGGWLMRMELAKLLLTKPDVLLLDEPTNHLDLPAIEWFEETLANLAGGVIVVSHDRSFLRRHANRIVELDGRGSFALFEGSYDRYLEARDQQHETLLAQKRRQDRQIAHLEGFVERFRAKATKAKQAQSRLKALDKIERIEVEPRQRRRMALRVPDPQRSGLEVLRLDAIAKRFEETVVYRGVSLTLHRGDHVAVAGPNGAGKSTLLRIAAGVLAPDEGQRKVGHNVSVAYFGQHQLEQLDASRSVLAELESCAEVDDMPRLRSHLGAFLFVRDDVEKRISVLSGGEKARVALAKLLLRPRNFLVLDEPTNHLDVESREVLEQALARFAGTILFVSHDRSFINAVATRVVEVGVDHLEDHLGNYDDYVDRKRGAGRKNTDAKKPRAKPRQIDREARKKRERIERRVGRVEDSILEREEEKESLLWKSGDPDAYRDQERQRDLETKRTANDAAIAELYAEWERLAGELEALEEPDAEAAPGSSRSPAGA